jgi:DNA excision repair protein ERCC-1
MPTSNEEVAQYLVSFKQQETSSAHILKEKIHQTYHNQLAHVLTSGKKVNKTDADNLASQFGVSQTRTIWFLGIV